MNSLIVALTFAVTYAVSIDQVPAGFVEPAIQQNIQDCHTTCAANLAPPQSGIVFNLCAEDVPTTGTLDISQCWTCGSGCGTDQASCDLL